MVNKQVQAIGEMDCILQESKMIQRYFYGADLIEAEILWIGNSLCKEALIVDDDGGWIFPSQVIH